MIYSLKLDIILKKSLNSYYYLLEYMCDHIYKIFLIKYIFVCKDNNFIELTNKYQSYKILQEGKK